MLSLEFKHAEVSSRIRYEIVPKSAGTYISLLNVCESTPYGCLSFPLELPKIALQSSNNV